MSDFLQKLQPGDLVIIEGIGFAFRDGLIASVDRVTKTQVILDSGRRFRRADGREIGRRGWTSVWIEEATKEKIQQVKDAGERRTLISRIKNAKWDTMTLEDLRKVYDAIWPH